ncbi:MAG: hypothetical protein AAF984_07680 [Verrucomicrobiota bacterium]
METFIHCQSCGEDMNRPDWEANGCCCLHCGDEIASPFWERRQYFQSPLLRARNRIDFNNLLRNGGAYAG